MKDTEQENKQMQAEIIDRIDSLHAAQVRHRAGWIGSMTMVAVACGIWLWPADVSQPMEQHPPLVAQHITSPQPSTQTAEEVEVKCSSPKKPKSFATITPDEVALEPDAEEPVMTPETVTEKEIAHPPVVETHEQLVAAVEEAPSEPQGVVRLYETPKRHRGLKGLFDAANNPNTDGTTLSIKFNIKTSKS